MFISRRRMLQLLAGTPVVLRAAGQSAARGYTVWQRRYRASAAVSLFSIPIATRDVVGSGFIQIEENDQATAIQFGAGSFPEKARGFNRFGFIQELIREQYNGVPLECSYFAFMTSAEEKSLEDAKRTSDSSGAQSPYAVANAVGRNGCFTSRVDYIHLSSGVTWRDYPSLAARVRAAISTRTPSQPMDSKVVELKLRQGEAAPATFLYAVRAALRSPEKKATRALIYNGGEFLLHTEKEADAVAGAHFAARNLAASASRVFVLNASLEERANRKVTPFRIWSELGQEHLPPLRFEYQAKSFLRLAFEVDPEASEPPITLALGKKENA